MYTVFHNSTTADASEVMGNFYHIFDGDRLPRGGDNFEPTTGVYDIGSSTYRWNQLFCENLIFYSISSTNKTVWRLIHSETLSAPATSIEITGLNSNNDKDYLLEFHLIDNTTASISLIFNGDSAASYGFLYFGGTAGAATFTGRDTGTSIPLCRATRNDTSTSIYASTWARIKRADGYPLTMRKVEINSFRDTSIYRMYSEACVWNQTATLTSMKFIASDNNAIGIGTKVVLFGRN
jgi:hypothetical protein